MTAEPSDTTSASRRRRLWPWLIAYIALLAVVVVSMLQTRRVTLETMSTPEALSQWEDWRQSDPNQRTDLPVKRRPPKSTEPPALVLMRDHFPVLMTAAIVFSSLLFVAVAVALRGSFQKTDEPQRATEGRQ